MEFSKSLIEWYLLNKRDLPWRHTQDPYRVFLSEIILQQTRVNQGLPYYLEFTRKYPTVIDLANTNEQEVLKTWQGLGYYSRARNLHFTAQVIANEHQGMFPNNYTELLKLKGIGEYTAAAIASFCFKEPVAVVDGNVFRVLSRVFGIETDIAASSSKKIFQQKATELLPIDAPDLFNQAIMEFGALQCKPKNPDCSICIFNTDCIAFNLNKVAQLPVKISKLKVKKQYLHYFVAIDSNQKTLVQKRTQPGIWRNLYEFPLFESNDADEIENIAPIIQELFKTIKIKEIIKHEAPIKHKLTHRELHIQFWILKTESLPQNSTSISEIHQYPFPIVIADFIKNNLPAVF